MGCVPRENGNQSSGEAVDNPQDYRQFCRGRLGRDQTALLQQFTLLFVILKERGILICFNLNKYYCVGNVNNRYTIIKTTQMF